MGGFRVAVVGGGLIGLSVAAEVLRRRPGAEVIVFEKEDRVAAHQSGRNSGVVHAGLYYEPGSLKAQLCRRGVEQLREFADTHGIAYQECGKVLVARDAAEERRLADIHSRAEANGVPGVQMLGPDGLRDVEPHASGRAALHSPQTAIIDYGGVARALAALIAESGGEVRLSREVTALEEIPGGRVRVRTLWDAEDVDLAITCAGLQSDRLARAGGDDQDPAIIPFFGDYFVVAAPHDQLVRGLIYPVPDPRYPFLGVHITRHISGEVHLGPNAFLSFARERYAPGRIAVGDLAEVLRHPGFRRFALSNSAAALREIRTVLSRRSFVEEAAGLLPELEGARISRGPRGIRAQAMRADGRLEDDFVISAAGPVVHVRNAPSPGATSSPAIAEHIVERALSGVGG
ncbi:MAG: L-2-hydroxyglutarate oxidase [Nesterenkonia sp.]|nr:L-2-hydroxyglutarate oxidase [Nesterenkonia sp.]